MGKLVALATNGKFHSSVIPAVANGSTWFNGAVNPDSNSGIAGDYYLNTVTGDVFQKAESGTWVLVANIKGPQGLQGAKGDTGDTGIKGATGLQGEKGDKGDTGAMGPQGIQGPQGPKGDAGFGIAAGAIQYFATKNAPDGWLKADGSAVSRTEYANLFAAVGTMFGAGDRSTTFNLPDLRGEFIRGWDNGRGIDSERSIGSNQISTQVIVDDDAAQVVGAIDWTNNNLSQLGYEAASTTKVSLHYNNATRGPESYDGSFARSIRPRNVALLACIKY